MRFLRALLLALLLFPAAAPCCAEAVETCCPSDRACEQGEICKAEPQLAALPSSLPPDVTRLAEPVLVAVEITPARALDRPLATPQRVPLRN